MTSGAGVAVGRSGNFAQLPPETVFHGRVAQDGDAASVLLTVFAAAPSFARVILGPLEPPAGRLDIYGEVPLGPHEDEPQLADGAIVITEGHSRWACLIKMKTGTALFEPEQVAQFLERARRENFDVLLTISNQIIPDRDERPFGLSADRVGQFELTHISWSQILARAAIHHRFGGVDDPRQARMLEELIGFLADEERGP